MEKKKVFTEKELKAIETALYNVKRKIFIDAETIKSVDKDEEITINLAQALLLNAVRKEVDGVPFVMQILRRLKRQYKQWLIVS